MGNDVRWMPRTDYDVLERLLNYQFGKRDFLFAALTSEPIKLPPPEDFADRGPINHKHAYDVLENLGDGALTLAIRVLLGRRYPALPVGERSRMEHLVTCNANLAHLAFRMTLMEWLVIPGAPAVYTRKMLADVVEGLLGAIYSDAAQRAVPDGCGFLTAQAAGFSTVLEVCSKLFAVDLELVQVDEPYLRLQQEVSRRWGEHILLRYFQKTFRGQFVGAACKLVFQKKAAQAIGKPSITATGYTPEGAMLNAAALAMLYLAPNCYKHLLPSLAQFSWKIKPSRTETA